MKPSDSLTFSCFCRVSALALLLSGCNAATGWQRGNTADATRDTDYSECKAEMRAASGSRLGVDQDIQAARGADWRQTGTYDVNSSTNTGGDAAYANHVLYSCMVDKGYHPRP
jgi:hypothetical protein